MKKRVPMPSRLSRFLSISAASWAFFFSTSQGGEYSFPIQDWKAAVQARLEIEKRLPGTRLLFQGKDPADRAALHESLGLDKSDGLSKGWVTVARALALPALVGPSGAEELLSQAALQGQGHPGFLFEGVQVFLQSGRNHLALRWQGLLEREMLREGYLRLPDYAKIALLHARMEWKAKRLPSAQARIDFAERLDPLSPWNSAARLETMLTASPPWAWDMGAMWEKVAAIGSLMRYYHNGWPFLYNVMHGIRLVLQGLGLFLLLALSLRYFTYSTHLWAEKLPHVVDLPWRYAAIALLVLSPWVAGVGLAFLAAPLCLVLWKPANPSERGLLRLLLLGLLALPFALAVEKALLRHLDPKEGIHQYHWAYENGFDPHLMQELASYHPEKETDGFYRSMGLALQYRKMGNTQRAETILDSLESKAPGHPFILLEKGNLALALEDYPAAESGYLKAMKAAPTWVETWFNASQAALFQNRSDTHKQRLDRAADADAGYLTLFLRQNDESFQQTPGLRRSMDPMPRLQMAMAPLAGEFLSLGFLKEEFASGLLTVPAWAILALTFFCLLALSLRQKQYSQVFSGKTIFHCKICGKVMCRNCRKGVHCEWCYKSIVGVNDLRLREELVLRLHQRGKAVHRAAYRGLNTVLPGLGDLYLGLGGMPYIWLAMAISCWVLLLQVGHPLMEYPVSVMGVFAYFPWIPLLAIYLVYNAFTYLPGGKSLVAGRRKDFEL